MQRRKVNRSLSPKKLVVQTGGGFIQDLIERISPNESNEKNPFLYYKSDKMSGPGDKTRRNALANINEIQKGDRIEYINPKLYKVYSENIPRRIGEISVHPYDKILIKTIYNDGWIYCKVFEVANNVKYMKNTGNEGFLPFHVLLKSTDSFDQFLKMWFDEKGTSYTAGLPKRWYRLPKVPPRNV